MKLPWVMAAMLLLAVTFNAYPANAQDDDSDFEETAHQLLHREDVQTRIEGARPKPSGDALFDSYAAAIWEYSAPEAFVYISHNDAAIAEPALLPDSVLLDWEDEFGDDPRWWELRIYCRQAGSSGVFMDIVDGMAILEEAYERGIRSPALLMRLISEKQLKNRIRTPRDSGLPQFMWEGESSAELLLLLNEYTSRYPEHAWAYLERALLQFSNGNEAEALEDLDQSLAAPFNGPIPEFPVSSVIDSFKDGQVPGNEILAGMLIGPNLTDYNSRNWISASASLQLAYWVSLKLLEEGRFNELQTLHRAMLHNRAYYRMRDSGDTFLLQVIIGTLKACTRDYPDYLDVQQRKDLPFLIDELRVLQMEREEIFTALNNPQRYEEYVAQKKLLPAAIRMAENQPGARETLDLWISGGMGFRVFEEIWQQQRQLYTGKELASYDLDVVDAIDAWDWTALPVVQPAR